MVWSLPIVLLCCCECINQVGDLCPTVKYLYLYVRIHKYNTNTNTNFLCLAFHIGGCWLVSFSRFFEMPRNALPKEALCDSQLGHIYIAQYKLRTDPPISRIWKIPMNGSYNIIKVIISNSCPPVGNRDIVLPHTCFNGTLTDTKGSGHIGYGDFIINKITFASQLRVNCIKHPHVDEPNIISHIFTNCVLLKSSCKVQ